MRGIRHILGIEHAYWSRTSNEETLNKANWILSGAKDETKNWTNFKIPRDGDVRKIKLVSELIEKKQIKQLGHILRADHDDPLYQATFKDEGSFNVYAKNRVGRPRGHWAEDTMNKAMQQLANGEFDREDPIHYIYLIGEAINRNM